MCGDGVKSTTNMLSKGSASPYISHAIQFNETRVDSDYIRQLQKSGASDQIYVIIPFHASNYFFRSFHLLVWAGFRRGQSKKFATKKGKAVQFSKLVSFQNRFFTSFGKILTSYCYFPCS